MLDLNTPLRTEDTATKALELAKSCLQADDFVEAEAHARRAIQLAPTSGESYQILARAMLAQGSIDGAIPAAEEAVRLAPAYAEAWHTLAQAHLVVGQADQALAAVQSAIDAAPQYAEAYFTRGRIYQDLRQPDNALQSFRSALNAAPNYVEAMNFMGVVLQDLGRSEEAESALHKAIELRPDYVDAHNNLGFLLRRAGRTKEAAERFKVAHNMFEPHLVLPPLSPLPRTIATAKRAIRVAADMITWKTADWTRPNAWTDYRLLHQTTNGRSSDLISKGIAALSRRSLPEWRRSHVFPFVKESDVSAILKALERDGCYQFKERIDRELLDDMTRYARTAEADLVPRKGKKRAVFDPDSPIAAGYEFREADFINEPVFQLFAGDPLFHRLSQDYLGVEPKLAFLAMWWSSAFARIPLSHLAQLFHADLNHIKFLKLFVYLTDVDAGKGPHSFVRGSHRSDANGKPLRKRGLVRLSDEDIVAAYGPDRILDFVGPRGTAFLVDTRGFHKGHHPKDGHRLVFQMYNVNSLFPDRLSSGSRRVIYPRHPVLIETIQRQPRIFDGYRIASAG